jgi:hypothetical protein
MSNSREEAIGIRGKVNTFDSGFQVQHRTNERGVLMTESVVFLTCPRTRFDIIKTADVFSPFRFLANLDEFGVLNHHRMHDPKKRFIRGKNSESSRQSITFASSAISKGMKNLATILDKYARKEFQ